jgi:hypothetical protein
MNYKRMLDLFWEFARKIEAIHALYLDSVVGYAAIHDRLRAHQDNLRAVLGAEHHLATEEFQDTCSTVYSELGGKDFSLVSMSPVMKQGQVKARVKENGTNVLLLANQCIVELYSYWEEYLRIEIGKAMGVLPMGASRGEDTRRVLNDHVKSALWADIKHLRNSIVHNNGIATAEVAKCTVITWFKPADRIELDQPRMQKLFLLMGRFRNELHSLSMPPRKPLRVPAGPNRG